jgi:hypothetical protein
MSSTNNNQTTTQRGESQESVGRLSSLSALEIKKIKISFLFAHIKNCHFKKKKKIKLFSTIKKNGKVRQSRNGL